MIHSMLVVFLTVLGVSYGRHWTNLEELDTYLTPHYDETKGFETPDDLDIYEMSKELPLSGSHSENILEVLPSEGLIHMEGQASFPDIFNIGEKNSPAEGEFGNDYDSIMHSSSVGEDRSPMPA